MSMHWEKLCAPNIWLNIRGMGGVGLISPLEFLQLQLVIGFLDLLVQSAQISLYSLQTCIPHKRGKAAPAPILASLVKALTGTGIPLRSGYAGCFRWSYRCIDPTSWKYITFWSQERRREKGKKEDEIYGILRIILFQPPVLVGEFDSEVLLLSRSWDL